MLDVKPVAVRTGSSPGHHIILHTLNRIVGVDAVVGGGLRGLDAGKPKSHVARSVRLFGGLHRVNDDEPDGVAHPRRTTVRGLNEGNGHRMLRILRGRRAWPSPACPLRMLRKDVMTTLQNCSRTNRKCPDLWLPLRPWPKCRT